MTEREEEFTDFGYQRVPKNEKVEQVEAVFGSVAPRYDLMNDLMSFGIHRLWKRFCIAKADLRPQQTVMDLAGGTGDLSLSCLQKTHCPVYLVDINRHMLDQARTRFINEGVLDEIKLVQASAEALPFRREVFDRVLMAFGLRNVTDKARALRSIWQTLKPGGRLVVLEFSHVKPWLAPFYDTYSFSVLPRLGKLLLNDAESYQYLVESIRMHPNQDSLQQMMETAGFESCSYQNLSQGIVAIHTGFKF